MSIRLTLRALTAVVAAAVALSLAPTTPALADEPGVRTPRVRVAPPPRVRPVARTRTVVRYVPVQYTCGGCARSVVWEAPRYYAPRYYAPRYYAAGCGGCAYQPALPYYWAVRTARYHAYRYHY
jgi:hypothetical protein